MNIISFHLLKLDIIIFINSSMLINNGSNQNAEIPLGFLINDSGLLYNCASY